MNKYLLAVSLLLFSVPSIANEKASEAAAAYELRDYDTAGIQSVQDSITLYIEAIGTETDADLKIQYMNALSSSHYFMGSALEKKKEKMAAHTEAMNVADSIITTLGIDVGKAHELSQSQVNSILNRLNDIQELELAEAFYNKGINLAQWGNLNGISSSISKVPQVLGLMERIEMMGYQSIHSYGPFRTIGRIKFKLPKIFGGDLEKSEKLLKEATQKTLATGQRYSVNGYNNIYFAETLYKRGKENQAKRLLNLFINADFSTLSQGSEPENREAIRVAEELAAEWN